MTGDNLQQDITWQDVLIAEDALMEALIQKRYDDPEHGEYWQERLATEMLRRQEILILAKEQEEQQFMQALSGICENVLNKREEQRSEYDVTTWYFSITEREEQRSD